MYRRFVSLAALAALAIAYTCAPKLAMAAPGFTYEVIASNAASVSLKPCAYPAINNNGDVAYATEEPTGNGDKHTEVFVARRGLVPEKIWEGNLYSYGPGGPGAPIARNNCEAPLSINDDGVVAVPVAWATIVGPMQRNVDALGYVMLDAASSSVLREYRNLNEWGGPTTATEVRFSTARINAALHVADGRRFGEGGFRVRDGDTTVRSFDWPGTGSVLFGAPTINERGDAAVAYTVCTSAITGGFCTGRVHVATLSAQFPNGAVLELTPSEDWNSRSQAVGLNDNGWIAYVSNPCSLGLSNGRARVALISPEGSVLPVAEANGNFNGFPHHEVFHNPWAGPGLNNWNQVLFYGSTRTQGNACDPAPAAADSLWIGDASGDAPIAVVLADETVESTAGLYLRGVGSPNGVPPTINVNSFNDGGDVVWFAKYDESVLPDFSGGVEQKLGIIVARPEPGMTPGNPILPCAGCDLPGGGWRIDPPPMRGFCANNCRRFVDPPIAVGYEYTMDAASIAKFESVLIPVALPGGDDAFTVEYASFSEPLHAGTAYYFTTNVPGGVFSFRIVGIDQTEELAPDDAQAFVSGLTWIADVDTEVGEFTMVPIVENTDDTDGDGVIESQDNCPLVANADQEDLDGDDLGDVCDVCTGGATTSKPQLKLSNLGSPGLEKLQVKGTSAFSGPVAIPPVDVANLGMRVLVTDLGAGNAVILDHTVPGGLVPTSCGSTDGWSVSGAGGTTQKYTNTSNATPPVCATDSALGIYRAQVKDKTAKAKGVQHKVQGKNGTYGPVTGPFRVSVAYGGSAESLAGQCAEHTFAANQCKSNSAGTSLTCK